MAAEIKFCGLTRPADAAAAFKAGATYLGVIFADSPRRLTPEAARAVLAAGTASTGAGRARRVGVFGPGRPEEIGRLAAEADVDIVQLHGDPDAADVEGLRAHFSGEIWAVMRLDGRSLPDGAGALAAAADAMVIDAKAPGALGGTGRTLDWRGLGTALDVVRHEAPLVLAGGLTPENVAAAIAALGPDVVDVSSGIERAPGIKDHVKMRAFADAARLAHRE